MSLENKVIGSMPVENLPVKRKRGRPRKDDSVVRRVRKPAVETRSAPVNRSTCRDKNPVSNGDDTLVGVAVSGVLEGTFDAGYVIRVRVGESDTFLRGVVFDSKFVLPVSASNDIASNVKMVKRHETSIATPVQLQGAARQVEQTNELADGLPQPPSMNAVPFQTQSSTPVALKGVQFDINQLPQASPIRQAETRTISLALVPSGGQGNEASQAVQLPSQSTYQNTISTVVLQNAGIDGNGTMAQQKPGPVIETSQGNRNNSKVTEAPQKGVDGASKIQVVDLNDMPVDGAADFLASEAIGDPAMKNKAFEGNHASAPPGMQSPTPKLVAESSKTVEANHIQSTCVISIKAEISLRNEPAS